MVCECLGSSVDMLYLIQVVCWHFMACLLFNQNCIGFWHVYFATWLAWEEYTDMSCVTPGNFLRVTRSNCLPARVKKNASDLLDHANTLHHSFTLIFGFDAMVGIIRSKVFFCWYYDWLSKTHVVTEACHGKRLIWNACFGRFAQKSISFSA